MSPDRAIRILRARDRTPVPWKNGGGLTREVAVHPEGSGFDDFDWRLSIAEVHAGGPFSSFPGIERQLAVLSGRLVLSLGGGEPLTLSPQSPPLRFAGEMPVLAQAPHEAVTDLNLMTRRARCTGLLSCHAARTADSLIASAGATVLIALGPLTLAAHAGRWRLGALDAALIARSRTCALSAPAGEEAAYYLAEIELPA
ncbi:MAG TPA: HutD family protein [Steroidobacteraceae bacterium]|nr:HutD family protein [Steroidobacteraceae bacterium]